MAKKKPPLKEMIKEMERRMGIGDALAGVTTCNRRTYKVIEQSDEFYILDDPDGGKPFAIRKDECRVEVIAASVIR